MTKYITAKNKELFLSATPASHIANSGAKETQTGTAQNEMFQGAGGDRLVGGGGDDSYNLWDTASYVVEKAGEGVDTVYVKYGAPATLGDNVENLVLENAWATSATGNALNNIIIAGTSGATLDGRAGDDVLVGGAGADLFKVAAGNGSDAIVNFKPSYDVIQLTGYGITTFDQLKSLATQTGTDVKFSFANGEILVVRDTKLSDLSAYDFGMKPAATAPNPGEAQMTNPSQYYSAHGYGVLNNVWNPGTMVAGKDYSIDSTFNKSDVSAGTTFNWSFPITTELQPMIRAYPEILMGYSPWETGKYAPKSEGFNPVQVSDISGLTLDYDVSFKGNLGGFNVAFDIFLTNQLGGGVSTITNELMIWVHKGGFDAYGTVIGSYSDGTISGKIYANNSGSSNYIALVLDQDVPKGAIDVADILGKLQKLGLVSPSEYVASIQLGAEVTSGSGSLTIKDLDVVVTTTNADGSSTVRDVTGSGTTITEIPAKPDLSGDNSIVYDAHAAIMQGGEGNDTLILKTAVDVNLGNITANQAVTGSAFVSGFENVDASAATARVSITGSEGSNQIIGSQFGDTLLGGAGSDEIRGGNGADYIDGGSDRDKIHGDDGDDRIVYDANDYVIDGGAGRDTLIMKSGALVDLSNYMSSQIADSNAYVTGFENVDASAASSAVTLKGWQWGSNLTGSNYADTLVGGAGWDVIDGGNGNDYIDGNGGGDRLYGGAGNDRIVYNIENSVLDGGAGNDTLILRTATTVNLGNYATSQVAAGNAYVKNFENVDASGANGGVTLKAWQHGSTLTGGAHADTLIGDAGWDVIYGGDGNDYIDGTGGGDRLYGEAGNDRIVYNAANSVIDGGAGNDTLILNTAATVNLANYATSQVSGGNAYVKGFENVDASGANAGVSLTGSEFDNKLVGSAYADVITSGGGANVMTGGGGADTFKFSQFLPGKSASITDFSSAQGDKIDLSSIDAISGGAKNAFSFIGDHGFNNVAGELRFGASEGGVTVQGDIDGNGHADFSFFVATTSLTQHDFVL